MKIISSLVYTKIVLIVLLLPNTNFAQDKLKIDSEAYDGWNTLKSTVLSPKGTFVVYNINPHKGDGTLFIQKTDKTVLQSIERGKTAKIHYNENFVAYQIGAQFDSLRQLKLDKVKKDKFPKDTLGIYWVDGDSTELIPNIKSFKLAKEGDWIAYLLVEDTREDCKVYKCKIKQKRNKCTKDKTTGTTLVVYNPLTKQKEEIFQVKEYYFNENGTQLAYVTSQKGEKDSLSLMIRDLNHLDCNTEDNESCGLNTTISSNALSIKSITFDKSGTQLAFLESNDTNKRKVFELGYWSENGLFYIDSATTNMVKGWTVSEFNTPKFSRDGKKLFFGTNKIVEQVPEDSLLANDKSKVDVWSWNDKQLQPMQLKRLKQEQRKNYLAVYHIATKEFVQLANQDLPNVRIYDHNNSNFALGVANENHQKEQSWAFPWKSDYYLVNVENGSQTEIDNSISYGGTLSPSGEYFVWYNGLDSTWHSKVLNENKSYNLTKSIAANFASDNNGNPFVAYPEGRAAWVKENGKERLLIYSQFDIWLVDPSGMEATTSITNQIGKSTQTTYRLTNLERDSTYITINNNLFHGVDKKTKDQFYVKPMDMTKRYLQSNHNYYFLLKAKQSDKVMFRKANFQDYPELTVSDMNLIETTTLTETNPQQKDYNWGTVEQVNWKSYKGLALDGLLYKPENFDSTKNYPMIVYFYEKYADNIHNHYIPKPTASIIFATEYVSNGYIVFIPDVLYTEGHPAKSAYDCILSGTDYLTEKCNWIDTTKLALQGQSWGGYQTAQLITMTNKYACGMAGAPVSNMFSAYGGIRWGSGMSRQFQYERTQSRIGCTIWECPELYIENSPIFGLPNVHTPLLIMHNDGDGAVPWYQGIEMFMGLRRLNKPVWMLNYNGDEHNLMKDANRRDLSIRMRQFFDYYLLDAPMPLWMKNGVKAIDKGKKLDLELEE
jgi:dipeptidyl aminopeptidase/acylaminoacyl peptidase